MLQNQYITSNSENEWLQWSMFFKRAMNRHGFLKMIDNNYEIHCCKINWYYKQFRKNWPGDQFYSMVLWIPMVLLRYRGKATNSRDSINSFEHKWAMWYFYCSKVLWIHMVLLGWSTTTANIIDIINSFETKVARCSIFFKRVMNSSKFVMIISEKYKIHWYINSLFEQNEWPSLGHTWITYLRTPHKS